jgi:hypothetical protein
MAERNDGRVPTRVTEFQALDQLRAAEQFSSAAPLESREEELYWIFTKDFPQVGLFL